MSNWTENRVVDWARSVLCDSNKRSLGTGWNRTGLLQVGRRSTLLRAVDHTTVGETLSGIRALMFDLEYSLSDEETIWDEAPKTGKRKKSKPCRRGTSPTHGQIQMEPCSRTRTHTTHSPLSGH